MLRVQAQGTLFDWVARLYADVVSFFTICVSRYTQIASCNCVQKAAVWVGGTLCCAHYAMIHTPFQYSYNRLVMAAADGCC